MVPGDKNLHAAVPPTLLARIEQAAQSEHGLSRREFEDVLAFGRRHAQARRLTPADIVEAIAEERARDGERGH